MGLPPRSTMGSSLPRGAMKMAYCGQAPGKRRGELDKQPSRGGSQDLKGKGGSYMGSVL